MPDAIASSAADSAGPTVYFERLLQPHRSLPPLGFHIVMAVLGVISFAMGVGFLMLGAWPVCGFFGLDVALVYLAFRINYRGARLRELLRLTEGSFAVERTGIKGERRHWDFQPYWLRVTLEERGDESNRLLVTSHGKSLVLASFLGAEQRRTLAGDIREALARWRASMVFTP
jgi:uncharacterized membrane protein